MERGREGSAGGGNRSEAGLCRGLLGVVPGLESAEGTLCPLVIWTPSAQVILRCGSPPIMI